MKIFTITAIIGMMIFNSCTYDKGQFKPSIMIPPGACADTVHYAATLQPILNANCTVCHSPGGSEPYFDYTTYIGTSPQDSAIVSRINLPTSNPLHMPQGGGFLDSTSLQLFYCWWKQGAPQ